jgi:glycerophosphoryl diester phosphodiesterase
MKKIAVTLLCMKKYVPVYCLCDRSMCICKKEQHGQCNTFDFEAHRGGRGLMPENTIAAMRNAISMKEVQTLEMDVHITKDGQVVVSHDPYFNALITTTPEGKYLQHRSTENLILYQMNYADIKKYDVG